MLDWVLDNLDECRVRLQPIKEMIVSRNSWPAFKRKMQKVLDALPEWPSGKTYKVFRQIVLQLIERGGSRQISLQPVFEATKPWRKWPLAMKSTYACYQAVRDMDDMSSAIPLLIAKEEELKRLNMVRKVLNAKVSAASVL
mgnify:CR=1 FL=1